MKFAKIPSTDIEVSKICIGTMNWGQQNNEAEAHEQLDAAISLGVNFIDTAEVYPVPPVREKQGITEEYVGAWLKKQGNRKDLIIASKVSGIFQSAFIGRREAADKGLTRENILKAVDGTLERLGVDYVDLYQVHVPDRKTNNFNVRGVESLAEETVPSIEETLGALGELVKNGKVRYVGVSNESPWGLNEYLRLSREKGLPRVVTIQNQYSLTNRTFEIGLSEIALRENIGLLPYSPLSHGVLSGKYLGGATPPVARFTIYERNKERYNAPHIQPAITAYVNLAEKYGLNPSQMALAFVNDRAFTTSTIIGTTSVEQVKTDVASADITLSPEILAEIKEIYTTMPDPQC
ncbi:aldo/keto reductase [Candidatus Kaiserbacteria bacterium]|nr:aldo/keto reductase [Candidatus Kaiserbacteria bacterium]